jgi:exosome complex RNA-binding protein Rrp4
MSKTITLQKTRHSPTLNTVMMVENVIKNAKGSVITIPEIKRALPRQVNHSTLKVVLEYLEASGRIVVTLKGITWIHNTNTNLRQAIAKGMEI